MSARPYPMVNQWEDNDPPYLDSTLLQVYDLVGPMTFSPVPKTPNPKPKL